MSLLNLFFKPKPVVTVNIRSGEQHTVAIGAVPDRTDRLASLHVGSNWVLINQAEFDALVRAGRLIFDRREGLYTDTGHRFRRGDNT